MSVDEYLQRVNARLDDVVDKHGFHPTQRKLLIETLEHHRKKVADNALGNPVVLLYVIQRAWSPMVEPTAILLGSFCTLYLHALDLFDDVQDNDLDGRPHASVGPAFAINSALTFLFLAFEEMRYAIESERDEEHRLRLVEVFNRISLLAVKGQHLDLMGDEGTPSLPEVLAMQQAKTSSLALIFELGALSARCDERAVDVYRRVGECASRVVQLVDDLRDIFGKPVSPDLLTGKRTFPVTCFFERSDPERQSQLRQLVAGLPRSMPEVRRLLYESGAVHLTATAIELARREAHGLVSAIGVSNAYQRLLLFWIDGVSAGGIYRLSSVRESASLLQPSEGFHGHVQRIARRIRSVGRSFGLPELPPLRPWHLPHFAFSPDLSAIFYPDIEDMPAPVVEYHSMVTGLSGAGVIRAMLERLTPPALAHEAAHFFRHATGVLTEDHWIEELMADRFAHAYCLGECPQTLCFLEEIAQRIVETQGTSVSVKAVLEGLSRSPPQAALPLLAPAESARVHAGIVLQLSSAQVSLEAELKLWKS